MRKWLLALAALFISVTLVVPEAEARRLGGARSLGVQRSVTTPPKQAVQQQKSAPGAQQAAPGQAQPQGFARWFPMLGGLALGGMLGWLFATNGGSLLLLLLLAFGTMFVLRTLARRSVGEHAMQYAGGRGDGVRMPAAGGGMPAYAASRIPAGFDADGFLRGAKMNFVRLQVANDRGELDEIREFTTPDMFEALAADLSARGGSQQTEVSGLDAQLLEIATEGGQHWASVRFSGLMREAPGAAAEPFEEVWNLTKPVDGSSGWLLAGIQQVN